MGTSLSEPIACGRNAAHLSGRQKRTGSARSSRFEARTRIQWRKPKARRFWHMLRPRNRSHIFRDYARKCDPAITGLWSKGYGLRQPFRPIPEPERGKRRRYPRGFQPHFRGHWVIAFQVGAVSCLSERMTGCPGGCRDDLIQGFEEERGGLREYCGALLCCTCMPVRVGEVCLAKPLATLLAASCRGVRTSFIRVRHALAYRFCLLPVRTHPRTSRGFPDNSSLVV